MRPPCSRVRQRHLVGFRGVADVDESSGHGREIDPGPDAGSAGPARKFFMEPSTIRQHDRVATRSAFSERSG